MSSLNALNDLRNILQSYYEMKIIPNLDSNLNTIEKDLEILEIFKKHISIRIESFNMGNVCLKKESIRYNGLDLDITNEEEYNKIKDWILK